MSDDNPTDTKMPHQEVYKTLLHMDFDTHTEVQSLNGELGSHFRTQYDLHPDLKDGLPTGKKIYRVFRKQSELRARDLIRAHRANLDAVERVLDEEGHGADFAEMALRSAEPPKGSQPDSEEPVDAAAKQVESNVVALKRGIKQAKPKDEKKAKAEKPKHKEGQAPKNKVKPTKKAKTFTDEQREETAKGDALIRENLAEREELPQPDPAEAPGRFSITY